MESSNTIPAKPASPNTFYRKNVKLIAAVNKENVIGVNGSLPWNRPEDLRRFAEVTNNSTVIMGRKTWESLPKKPLPNRQNIILSRQWTVPPIDHPDVYVARDIEDALLQADRKVKWIIGGYQIFLASMAYCDEMDITVVPDVATEITNLTFFPMVPPDRWYVKGPLTHPYDSDLAVYSYSRSPLMGSFKAGQLPGEKLGDIVGIRKDWDQYFMEIAQLAAERATCEKKKVGCVIVKDRRAIATGYNGSIIGDDHCSEVGHMLENGRCVRTVQACVNAIAIAARHGLRTDDTTMYCTHAPSWECFKIAVNAGVKRFYYKTLDRDSRVMDRAAKLGIVVTKID